MKKCCFLFLIILMNFTTGVYLNKNSIINYAIEIGFLKKNEDLNLEKLVIRRNKYGQSLLMLAIKNKRFKIVASLLKQKVGINYKDKFGYSVLMYAIIEGDIKLVKTIIDYGAIFKEPGFV